MDATHAAVHATADFFAAVSEAMQDEINRSARSSMAFLAFLYGSTLQASEHHRVTGKGPGVFAEAMNVLGFSDGEAEKLATFCLSLHQGKNPWQPAVERGSKGYLYWANGSEVKALELLSETLSQAPRIDRTAAPKGSLAREVVAMFD